MANWRKVRYESRVMTNYIEHTKSNLVVEFLDSGEVEVRSSEGSIVVKPRVSNAVRISKEEF